MKKEEECRLLFVACSRAMDQLWITYSLQPSEFLSRIQDALPPIQYPVEEVLKSAAAINRKGMFVCCYGDAYIVFS